MGDFNINGDKENYHMILEQSQYKSSYLECNGAEPELTFPTGLQAEFMDTDPPGIFDFIFYRGEGIKVINSKRMGENHEPLDKTIYGSDHFAIVSEFEISA